MEKILRYMVEAGIVLTGALSLLKWLLSEIAEFWKWIKRWWKRF
jgi:hypothetical protein